MADDIKKKMHVNLSKVKVILANDENFAAYGNLFRDVDEEVIRLEQWPKHPKGWRNIEDGLGGGVTKGEFTMIWKDNLFYSSNSGVLDGDYCFAIGGTSDASVFEDHGLRLSSADIGDMQNKIIVWTEINYHACGSQYFYCEDQYMLAIIAVIDDETRWPDSVRPEDFICYIIPPKVGAHINAFVWHCPPIAIPNPLSCESFVNNDAKMRSLCKTAQGKVHSKIYFNVVDECKSVLAVNLADISAALT
jgi:hypothetical protein